METKYSNEEEWQKYCASKREDLIKLYEKRMNGQKLNLDNPQTINEKLNWLKIYDVPYSKTRACDKIELHNYCKEILGKDICVPIIKIYNNFDEINFDELPNNYVLKTNHGSQTNIIVKNKVINKNIAKKQFSEWLSKDWTWWGLEMPYERVPRKIYAEYFLYDEKQKESLYDYKFWCFNGEPKLYTINNGHGHGDIMYYKMDGTEYNLYGIKSNSNYKKPNNFELMKEYAKKLSKDFKFVRVDFYEVNNIIYLGELTFYPGAGYITYKNPETNLILGNMLKLD